MVAVKLRMSEKRMVATRSSPPARNLYIVAIFPDFGGYVGGNVTARTGP